MIKRNGNGKKIDTISERDLYAVEDFSIDKKFAFEVEIFFLLPCLDSRFWSVARL